MTTKRDDCEALLGRGLCEVHAVVRQLVASTYFAVDRPVTVKRLKGVRFDGKTPSIENALRAAYALSSGQRVDNCEFCGGKQSRGRRVVACRCKDQMVSTIIARQVEQGGVDTEGTRAQAERWCATLAGCVCEGMRATTRMSAYRMAFGTGAARADWAGYSDECLFRGKPLGRP